LAEIVMPLDSRLRQLLNSWEDRREAGHSPSAEEHCREYPELLEPFCQLLRRFEQIDDFGRGVPTEAGGRVGFGRIFNNGPRL
jgi:hypothetical protein